MGVQWRRMEKERRVHRMEGGIHIFSTFNYECFVNSDIGIRLRRGRGRVVRMCSLSLSLYSTSPVREKRENNFCRTPSLRRVWL